jgi:hypothetical protein
MRRIVIASDPSTAEAFSFERILRMIDPFDYLTVVSVGITYSIRDWISYK